MAIDVIGQLSYEVRVWQAPARTGTRVVTTSVVLQPLREQNVQVAAGALGREPMLPGQAFQYTLSTKGRLIEP